ncbi:hypothetical protein RND81_10G214300 [Saponaria officinalis]|uniref:KIB1-4 beta-propeller domain-containing protein n=1 Tax=Saponaria officinalis TaxID=3572 RepID=A0AAW1I5N2_SAPOF
MKESRRKMSNVCGRSRVCWSKLPGGILFKISKHLKTRHNLLAFRHVCSKWRKRSLELPENLLSFNTPLPKTIKHSFKVLPFHNVVGPLVLQVSNIYLITRFGNANNEQCLRPSLIMAEELNPGKIKVRHPLTAKRVKNLPSFLDLTRFKLLMLAQGYSFKSSDCVHKVLLCASSASSIDVLVLYYKGFLGKLSLVKLGHDNSAVSSDEDEEEEEGELCYRWENFKVRQGGVLRFMYLDDVAIFRDLYYGVDRRGKLYVIGTESMSVVNTRVVISEPLCRGDIPSHRKKRLVVDQATEELYLVVRENVREAQKVRFKVYTFNDKGKRWDVVENIGLERVLFIGLDHCFFALARHFEGCDGNCIVFAANCFTQYNGRDAPDRCLFGDEGIEVGVYRFGEGDNFSLLSFAFPEFSRIVSSTWFSTSNNEKTEGGCDAPQTCNEMDGDSFVSLSDNHAESLLSGSPFGENESSSDQDDDDDVEILSDCSDKDEKDCVDEDEHGDEEMESDSLVDSKASDNSERSHSAKGSVESKTSDASISGKIEKKKSDAREKTTEGNLDDQTLEDGFTAEKIFDASRTPTSPPFSSIRGNSCIVKFHGVDIRSELLPTLETTWAKHGNLVGEHTIRSKKMLGCAFEELAELIITVKNSTARTLTESQTDDMRSTVSDLKRAGLNVEWLEPVIENAAAVQKSRPIIEKIANVDKKRAKIEKQERRFLARTAKEKQELEEIRADLCTKIPFPKDQIIDLDDCLGVGI